MIFTTSDTGLGVLISWLRGGMRGQPKRVLPCLTSAGCRPRQTRLQNPTVWLGLIGRQESIGVFLQLHEGRQQANGMKLCQGPHTQTLRRLTSWLHSFRIPRPPWTVLVTTQVLVLHELDLWDHPRRCQIQFCLCNRVTTRELPE